MKRFFALFLTLILFLCGCSEQSMEINGITKNIGVENQHLQLSIEQDGKGYLEAENGTYRFSIYADQVKITYPNGESYTMEKAGGGRALENSYDEAAIMAAGYLPISPLGWSIFDAQHELYKAYNPAITHGDYIWKGTLIAVLGVFTLLFRKQLWWLAHGWHYANAEPSNLSLVVYGIIGILMMIGGFITMAVGFVSIL